MDELVIDDKKYISSKRAAQITGYAKDYVGQLCREGRVSARLVGRAWYVLESAIQDHRFGVPTPTSKKIERTTLTTWESPRYEAVAAESLPTVKRIDVKSEDREIIIHADTEESSHDERQAWGAWFDLIASQAEVPQETIDSTSSETLKNETEKSNEKSRDSRAVDIPVRVERHGVYGTVVNTHLYKKKRPKKAFGSILHTLTFLVTFGVLSLAILNSGYVDQYIYSYRQAHILSGILFYKK